MEILYLLIPISLVVVFVIAVIFWWSLRSGQYDDLEGPAHRLLMDDRDDFPSPPAQDAGATTDDTKKSATKPTTKTTGL